MSTIGKISGSNASYGVQIAQAASLKRSLNNLGTAIQTGNLSSAGSILTGIVKANPQFSVASSTTSTASSDPINNDFKAISNAIDKNDVQGAQSAFEQLKTDLAKDNITINDGTEDTAKLLAKNRATINETILANTLGSTSATADNLFGISSNTTQSSGLESLVKDWLTYKAGGQTDSSSVTQTGSFDVTI